ncbi:MAG TPA: DUF2863 family protein [Burkholderiaceae bacterium]|nr:DUF2863 family protein [Burkholderiaceae bacterium]
MRRQFKRSSSKLSADSQRLVAYAQAAILASSRLEERGWERHLDLLLRKLLKNQHQDTIDAALDHAFRNQSGAYDALMESVEAVSESCTIEHEGKRYDALLVSAPLLAWTRFSIWSGTISGDTLTALSAHLYAHVLASNTRMAMAPMLFAIDQLPHTHAETMMITQHLAQAAFKGTTPRRPTNAPETAPFLADTRYLLAAVVVPEGEPVFRWQESLNSDEREQALTQWRAQASASLTRLLPGCGIELLLPEAYYVACREADRRIRPASIRAAVYYLIHTLGVEPASLHAIVGGFGDELSDARVDEYRIGFKLPDSRHIVYGLVWPLYGQEDEERAVDQPSPSGDSPQTPLEQILALLRECGVTQIKQHGGYFAMESCEDCGAPLYLDLEADLVHAEMPEDATPATGHFH